MGMDDDEALDFSVHAQFFVDFGLSKEWEETPRTKKGWIPVLKVWDLWLTIGHLRLAISLQTANHWSSSVTIPESPVSGFGLNS